MKAVAVYLKLKFEEQFVKFPSCHVLAVGVLKITIIFNIYSDIQIFLNGDVLLNGS